MVAPNASDNSGSLRVLVVEDSLIYQKLAIRALEQVGHVVNVASNGKEAIDAIRSYDLDLVLMDVEMPEMDGLEATRQIRDREQKSGTHVPIVGLTTTPDPERCLAAGMDAYLLKPYPSDILLNTIDRVLHQASRRPSTDTQKRVLLADDDPQFTGPLQHALEAQGHNVVVATGCQDAVEMADSLKPDLMMLDIIMPECNGLHVLQRLRNTGFRELPVIVMTGSEDKAYEARAKSLGAMEYLRKPISPTEVVARVNRFLAA